MAVSAGNAGTGLGQVVYEIYFNYGGYGATRLYPNPESPNAAAKYRSLKRGSGGTVNPPPQCYLRRQPINRRISIAMLRLTLQT